MGDQPYPDKAINAYYSFTEFKLKSRKTVHPEFVNYNLG